MRTLVIYDSAYGNTAKVARAIGLGLGVGSKALLVSEVSHKHLDDIDLLVVGSPTQGGNATKPIQDFIHGLPQLKRLKVAAFDTRFARDEHGFWLGLLMKVIGFAAEKISAGLRAKGAEVIHQPTGFIVSDQQGPLKDGELDRAVRWGRRLSRVASH